VYNNSSGTVTNGVGKLINGTWHLTTPSDTPGYYAPAFSVKGWPASGGCPAMMATPAPGSTLSGANITFTWGACAGAQAYWLDVGTVAGQGNIFARNVGLSTSQTVNSIPTNGQTIYVQLWTQINGTWTRIRYTYTAYSAGGGTKAEMSSPAPGSVLSSSQVAFVWSAGTGAMAYWLDVGTVQGQGNVFGQNVGLATSRTVTGIHANDATTYVRLWTQFSDGSWQFNDYVYSGTLAPIALRFDTCPHNDPAYSTIRADFAIRREGAVVGSMANSAAAALRQARTTLATRSEITWPNRAPQFMQPRTNHIAR
jgi:hypothetical protein